MRDVVHRIAAHLALDQIEAEHEAPVERGEHKNRIVVWSVIDHRVSEALACWRHDMPRRIKLDNVHVRRQADAALLLPSQVAQV